MKRILAIAAIVLLVALYLSTLIFALIDSDLAFGMFKASLLMTFVIPVLLYAMMLIYNFINKKK